MEGKNSCPSSTDNEGNYTYGGIPEEQIKLYLYYCLSVQGMTHSQTRKFFHKKLGLTGWTINPYQNYRTDMVTVWKEGEETYLHYYIEDLCSDLSLDWLDE